MATSTTKVNAGGRGGNVTDIDGMTGSATQSTPEIEVNEGAADNRSQLTKLSLAQMGCQPELSMISKGGKEVLQAVIFGQITGLTGPKKLPNMQNGQEEITYGLVGRIEAVNVLSGEMFKTAILYLPSGFHDMFLGEAESQIKEGEQNVALAFALEFYSIPATNPRGYSWKAKNKLAMEKTDPLAGLRKRALTGVSIKALAGPNEGAARIAG